ncbi:MAG: ATP-binding protein [Pseudomonadota bacterium]
MALIARLLTRWRGASLAAQTGLLLLGCLMVAQWAAIWAFCDERAATLRAVAEDVAVRELTLIAAADPADPAALSRDGLTVWTSSRRPEALPPALAHLATAAPGAAWASGALPWREGAVDLARLGHEASLLSLPLPDGTRLNAALAMPRWTDPWAMQSWGALALTSLGLLLASGLIAHRVTGPMRALATAADGFRGAEAAPIAAHGPAEMRRTLDAFNAMQDRISALVAERTRILSALGHDLRTPLTRLKLRADLVEDDEMRGPVLRDLGEIEELGARALQVARGSGDEPHAVLPVDAVLEELAGDLAEAGLRVRLGPLAPVTCDVRRNSLRRAVTNLVENADRYGGGATLSLEGGDVPRIVVRDDGPGIPEDRLAAVMEPFVRLDGSRAKHSGGSGLGLALAATTAHEHGGRLTLTNRRGGGLEAAISLGAGGAGR